MINTLTKLIVSVVISCIAWNYPDYNNINSKDRDSGAKEWVKNATRKYSPDSWDLLMKYESLPEKPEAEAVNGSIATTEKSAGTFYYLEGRNRIELLSSMATNVHEIAHGYCNLNIFEHANERGLRLDMDRAEVYFYYSPSRSFFISFPLKSLFPSRELLNTIPGNLRTFRFETYIDGITSTQSEGIIGLLNELHSYYLESKFCFEMFEAYVSAKGSEASGLFEWVYSSQSKMTAFFEFDFFIKEYLLLMKRKYPAQYRELRNSLPFTEPLSAIRISYKNLVYDYMQKIRAEMTSLNSSGNAEVRIENNKLWIREANSDTSIGTPVFSADREILMPVLESDRYREIIADFPDMN